MYSNELSPGDFLQGHYDMEANDVFFEEIPIAASILDKKGIIRKYNKKCEEVIGFKKDEVIGKRWNDIIYFEKQSISILMESYNTKTEKIHHNVNLITKSMEIIPCNIKIYPLLNRENIYAIICFFDDISERVKMERKLLEAGKIKFLEKISIALAHEVKNPLMVLSGILSVIKSNQCDTCISRKPLKLAITEINIITNIIDNLLYFAREKKLTLKKIPIVPIISEITDSFKIILRDKNIRLTTILEDNLPSVNIDENSIKQILYNLLWNAISAIKTNGEIVLSGKILTKHDLSGCYYISKHYEKPVLLKGKFVYYLSPIQYIFISVTDSAGTLDISNINSLFDPFVSTRSSKIGLGLHITRVLVDGHEGSILVRVLDGKETKIGFLLRHKE